MPPVFHLRMAPGDIKDPWFSNIINVKDPQINV